MAHSLSIWGIATTSMPTYSKMGGSFMVRREHTGQSRPSQGDVIAKAPRIASRPGGPAPVLDLSPAPRVPVSAGAGTLCSASTPPRVQVAPGAASARRPPGPRQGTQPSRSGVSGLPALPAPVLCHLTRPVGLIGCFCS
jgi:hypothetical protein